MTKTVKHSAPWTISQIMSWVVPALIIVLLVVLCITGYFDLTGAIVISVITAAMGLFFLIGNSRLKKRSSLTAVLKEDEDFSIEVFQAKPRPYWNGKLDQGKNKGPIAQTKRVNFNDTEGIPYVLLSYTDSKGNSKAITIPSRILIQDGVRKYVAEGLSHAQNIVFRNEEEEARLAKILSEGIDPAL